MIKQYCNCYRHILGSCTSWPWILEPSNCQRYEIQVVLRKLWRINGVDQNSKSTAYNRINYKSVINVHTEQKSYWKGFFMSKREEWLWTEMCEHALTTRLQLTPDSDSRIPSPIQWFFLRHMWFNFLTRLSTFIRPLMITSLGSSWFFYQYV